MKKNSVYSLILLFACICLLHCSVFADDDDLSIIARLNALSQHMPRSCAIVLAGLFSPHLSLASLDGLPRESVGASIRAIQSQMQAQLNPADLKKFGVLLQAYTNSPEPGMPIGDFYQIIPLADGRIAIFFGDVMGHGLQAGSISTVFHEIIHTPKFLEILSKDPSEAMKAFDDEIDRLHIPGTKDILTATASLQILDPKTGKLEYVLAGHPPGLILHANGNFESLENFGPHLVISDQADKDDFSFKNYGDRAETKQLQPGDTVVFISDGFWEGKMKRGEESVRKVWQSRLSKIWNERYEQARVDRNRNRNLPLEPRLAETYQHPSKIIQFFTHSTIPLEDDTTVLAYRWSGAP